MAPSSSPWVPAQRAQELLFPTFYFSSFFLLFFLGLSIGNIHQAPAAAHSLSSAFILVCMGVGIVHVVVM